MEPAMAPARPPSLRPLQVGEILDAAMKVYRQRFGPIFKAAFVVVAPIEVLIVLIQLSIPEDAFEETADDAAATAGVFGGGAIYLLAFVGLLLVTALAMRIISDSYLGRPHDWGQSVMAALRKLPSLGWLMLLYVSCLFAGLPYCGVMTVYLYAAFSLCVPILMLEDVRGARALHRSRRLVEGRWWPVSGALLVAFLLTIVVKVFFTVVLFGAGFATQDFTVFLIIGTVLSIISSSVVAPFTAAVITIVYFDMRVRKEGFDLELLASSVGRV